MVFVGKAKTITAHGVARYEIHGLIQECRFGKVLKAYDSARQTLVALKHSDLTRKLNTDMEDPEGELKLLHAVGRSGGHPNVHTYDNIWRDGANLWCASEYANDDLFQHVEQHGHLKPKQARFVFSQLARGVEWIHTKCNIAHLDISPENVLVFHENDNDDPQIRKVKICDFGLAQAYTGDKFVHPAGKPYYRCPEMNRGEKYDGKKADIFALGATLFVMAYGGHPFQVASPECTRFRYIATGKLRTLLAMTWDGDIDDKLVDLLTQMLALHEQKRPTIEQVLAHPWLARKH